jgi:hypothetical protein
MNEAIANALRAAIADGALRGISAAVQSILEAA